MTYAAKYNRAVDLVVQAPSGQEILNQCLDTAIMLLEKNISYGDSALSPARIFSKASATSQLLTRIDDKLNRIMNAKSYPGDNDIDDLIGYLVLLKVAMKRKADV